MHSGESTGKVREELISTLRSIPYGEVVEVEQELINDGLPEAEVLKLCDIHGEVLEGNVDLSGEKEIPAGHPVDVFKHENSAIRETLKKATDLLHSLGKVPEGNFSNFVLVLHSCFNELMDIDKHYRRKEYLVFPYLEKNDKVKYFTQGSHRIFPRSRSIINRDVRRCHPPGSVNIVEKILEDFKSGKQSHAPFWIQMKGKFILIEYYALRNKKGEYLGTLEVSQDLTNARELKGERRILSYGGTNDE